ncbi:hypothetical protein A2U01_0107954, partial [Trifolium medium]|nr:hypothetical protein [Trifolium medium]
GHLRAAQFKRKKVDILLRDAPGAERMARGAVE